MTTGTRKDAMLAALKAAVARAGSQQKLATQSGITPTQVSDFIRQRRDAMNMPIKTFFKLFPDAKIDFFGDGQVITAPKTQNNPPTLTTMHHTIKSGSGNVVLDICIRETSK